MKYPEQINLPFNRQTLPTGFTLLAEPEAGHGNMAHWVILQGSNLVMLENNTGLALPSGLLPSAFCAKQPPLTFAHWQGMPVRCLQISKDDKLPSGFVAEPFNAFQERIPIELMTVSGLGKQLLHADKMTNTCPRCASKTVVIKGSWGKRCPTCSHESYPPIHACAIVLIKREDQLLLIRKPEWAKGRFGLVAGFLDVGESLEECAIREAREETGVTIKNLRYVTSQPWPFPSQLMVGFVADYASGDITLTDDEIEEARWFTLDNLPILPSKRSIARYLIDNYCQHL